MHRSRLISVLGGKWSHILIKRQQRNKTKKHRTEGQKVTPLQISISLSSTLSVRCNIHYAIYCGNYTAISG